MGIAVDMRVTSDEAMALAQLIDRVVVRNILFNEPTYVLPGHVEYLKQFHERMHETFNRDKVGKEHYARYTEPKYPPYKFPSAI